jgi:hypothetical protein
MLASGCGAPRLGESCRTPADGPHAVEFRAPSLTSNAPCSSRAPLALHVVLRAKQSRSEGTRPGHSHIGPLMASISQEGLSSAWAQAQPTQYEHSGETHTVCMANAGCSVQPEGESGSSQQHHLSACSATCVGRGLRRWTPNATRCLACTCTVRLIAHGDGVRWHLILLR